MHVRAHKDAAGRSRSAQRLVSAGAEGGRRGAGVLSLMTVGAWGGGWVPWRFVEMTNCGRGRVPLFGALRGVARRRRPRSLSVVLPGRRRGGEGRGGERSPVRSGEVSHPAAAAGIRAGLRAKGRTGRPVLPWRLSRPLAVRPRGGGRVRAGGGGGGGGRDDGKRWRCSVCSRQGPAPSTAIVV